jgi:hypothetical protein
VAVRVCWCRDCQYVGAGSGTVNLAFPAEGVAIEGALANHTSTADSGNVMHRSFCPSCGTPVTTQSEARLHLLSIRAGTLDDPDLFKPEITIWTSSAPSWARFDESLPQEPKQPLMPSKP